MQTMLNRMQEINKYKVCIFTTFFRPSTLKTKKRVGYVYIEESFSSYLFCCILDANNAESNAGKKIKGVYFYKDAAASMNRYVKIFVNHHCPFPVMVREAAKKFFY